MSRVRLCVLLTTIMYLVTIMGGTSSAAALPALRAFDATLTLSPTAAGQPLTATFDGTNPVIDVGGSCEASVDKALLPATCVNTGSDVLHPHWAVGFTVPASTQPGMHDVTVVANGDTASGTLEVPGPEVVVPDLHGLLYPDPAQQAANAAGLAVCPVHRVDGIVVDQNPPPGATRIPPRCVQVTLADAVRVPNLVGDQFPVAESAVQGAKLVLSPAGEHRPARSPRQTPAAGHGRRGWKHDHGHDDRRRPRPRAGPHRRDRRLMRRPCSPSRRPATAQRRQRPETQGQDSGPAARRRRRPRQPGVRHPAATRRRPRRRAGPHRPHHW